MAVTFNFTATVISPTSVRFEVTDPSMSDVGVNTTVTVYSDSSFQTVVATVQTDQPLGSDSYGMGVATGLTPSTTYYAKIPQNTSAVSFTTFSWGVLYGSVSGQAKSITKLYGSIPVLSTFSSTLPQSDETGGSDLIATTVDPTNLTVLINSNSNAQAFMKGGWDSGGEIVLWIANVSDVTIQLRTSKGSTYLVYNRSITPWGAILSTIESDYGITLTGTISSITQTVKITIPISPTVQSVSKKITKLYGSVNGQTKLIYQAQ